MGLIDVNTDPTPRQLRQFGGICLVALPLVGWLWGGSVQTIGWFALAGLVLAALGAVLPKSLLPIYLLLTWCGMPLGLVVGEVLLLLIYFGLFLPLGLFFRAIGRDELQLRLERSAQTYWQAKKQPEDAARYYRQS